MSSIIPGARVPQQRAVDAIEQVLQDHDRTQLRMACGVGKTLVGQYVAERLGSARAAVVTPSLDLVGQTLRAWLPRLAPETAVLVICSDTTAGLTGKERAAAGITASLVTTDPGKAGYFLQRHAQVLVVSTYQSLGTLRSAAGVADELDLLVLDEAHHLTGRLDRRYLPALEARSLPARRRLFMTATPVVLDDRPEPPPGLDPFDVDVTSGSRAQDMVSMDDHDLFGPVAFTYTVREAIRDGYLADYRVLVVARADTASAAERLPMLALVAAGRQYGVQRALTFHNRVADATTFTRTLNGHGSAQVRFLADAVHGDTSATKRREVLTRLGGETADGVVRVVSAARCLREGVDVCAVDAVMFAAPRSSTVDIIQAVGRSLRTYPGKTHGTIVIPVLLPAGLDDDEDLTRTSFAHVWKVLRGLNAHDPRVSQEMDLIYRGADDAHDGSRRHRSRPDHDVMPDWLEIVGHGVDLERVKARLVSGATPRWDLMLQSAVAAAEHHGGAYRIAVGTGWEGDPVGAWMMEQRTLHHQGVLSPARVALLQESVPGWVWSGQEILDLRMLDALGEFAREHGTSRDAPTGPSRYPLATGVSRMPRMARWLSRLRRAHRAGDLDERRIAVAEALPEWKWEPLAPRDRRGVEAYAAFVAWEKHGNVPVGHVEDGFAVGDWLDEVRCAYLATTLTAELHEELLAVAPTNSNSDPVFSYDTSRLRARLGLAGLRSYVSRQGSALDMPVDHVEVVHGNQVRVYQWCARQRWLHRRDKLDAGLVSTLEAVPGWVWDLRAARHTVGEPIELPAGAQHGTSSGGLYYRCPCPPCQEAKRATETRHQRTQMQRLSASHRPFPQAARHVAGLAAQHPHIPDIAVAAAAGMPGQLMRKVLTDPATAVPPRFGPVLAELTEADLLAWVRPGTRGRTISRTQEPGNAQRIEGWMADLTAAGWTQAMMAAELGYAGNGPKGLLRGGKVTLAAEHALRMLLDHQGDDLTPPAHLRTPGARSRRAA